MKIFCDGVFDLFHMGHINHFKRIKELYPESFLLVGVLNDIETTSYKRVPILDENKRLDLVSSCKYVDEAKLDYPSILKKEFIQNNNIELVVHAFSSDEDYNKQLPYFKVPIELNILKRIEYTHGISTTQLINDMNHISDMNQTNSWKDIWNKKGKEDSNNLFVLNGYEDTTFSPNDTINNIINKLKLKSTDKVLEIGSGAGLITQGLQTQCNYYGIDYSDTLVKKNILINNSKIIHCEANRLPFKDNYFDYTFSVGVFEYFPSKEYALQVIKEMERVSKNSIYILNIRNKTHEQKLAKHKYDGTFTHLIYSIEDFKEFKIVPSTYESENRFSVYKNIDKCASDLHYTNCM